MEQRVLELEAQVVKLKFAIQNLAEQFKSQLKFNEDLIEILKQL